MAIYEGSQGIAALKAKIAMKSKMLVGESLEKITTVLVDDSPLGAEYYHSKQGNIQNDVGDFKNSWAVGVGNINLTTRAADTAGTAAIADAIVKGKTYNLEELNYITNSKDYANMVENGWDANPEYGWKPKEGYHVVSSNIGTAKTIMHIIAEKISKI
jgi:hypothetical protein